MHAQTSLLAPFLFIIVNLGEAKINPASLRCRSLPLVHARRSTRHSPRNQLLHRISVPRSKNQFSDVIDSFIDIAAFVSDEGVVQQRSQYAELAQSIGRDAYVDINGWKLYWKDISVAKDVKLNELVAQGIGPRLQRIQPSEIDDFLAKVPMSMGGGKTQVPLLSITPRNALRALYDVVEDAARDAW